MSRFDVKPDQLRSQGDAYTRVQKRICDLEDTLKNIRSGLNNDIGRRMGIQQDLQGAIASMERYSTEAGTMHSALESICDRYIAAENSILGIPADIDNVGDADSGSGGFLSNLWNGAKDFFSDAVDNVLDFVGDAIEWVSDAYSAIEPFLDTFIGSAEIIVGVASMLSGGFVVGLPLLVFGWDKMFGGMTDIVDGNSGDGIKPIKDAIKDSLAWLGEGIGGETGAMIGEMIGSIIYVLGDTFTSLARGDISDLVDIVKLDTYKDLADSVQDILDAVTGDSRALIQFLLDALDPGDDDFISEFGSSLYEELAY